MDDISTDITNQLGQFLVLSPLTILRLYASVYKLTNVFRMIYLFERVINSEKKKYVMCAIEECLTFD